MREVVIIDAVRSPIGRAGGALSSVRPDDLLADVLKGLIKRTGIDPALIEDVYAGCGNQSGEDNRDVARMAVLLAGFPLEVGGVTVNRNCSSGLEAVNQAAKAIIAGEGDIFIGSGVESMSRAPLVMPRPSTQSKLGHRTVFDSTVDALGHPLGCSGARILTTLIHEMKKRNTKYGLATLCVGVGQGVTTLVEGL